MIELVSRREGSKLTDSFLYQDSKEEPLVASQDRSGSKQTTTGEGKSALLLRVFQVVK